MGAPTTIEVLHDPSTPYWLSRALTDALERDPVKAANEAEVLAAVLRRRADELLRAGLRDQPFGQR